MGTVISAEHVSKKYRLGSLNSRSLRDDITRTWARVLRRPDPTAVIQDAPHAPTHQNSLWALHDVNFEVKEGESMGIVGRNGAGKSTLLKILSHITSPTEGKVKIKGRISSLLEVGTGFHPELTGRENIYLNGSILGMKRADINRKLDQIIDFSGISQFIDTPVKRYSSGMYMRLAFSVAAHLDSEILILDEVIAVGDADFQKKSLEKTESSIKSGKTVLFVSHGLAAITRLCERGIYLEEGRVAYYGSATETASEYLKKIHKIDEKQIQEEAGKELPTYIDLRNSDKRWDGYTKKILAWASTHDAGDKPCSEFKTGDSIKIRVGYHTDEEMDGYCQINFLDYTGARVMQLHNTHSGASIHLRGDGYVECVIQDLRLLAGSYILMLEIGHYVDKKPQWLDCIGDTLHININLGDYLTGVGLSQSQVIFAQKSAWQVCFKN